MPVSQQELADAVGTVREVVVRCLRELREEGLLATARGRMVIIAPERLLDAAYARSAGRLGGLEH